MRLFKFFIFIIIVFFNYNTIYSQCPENKINNLKKIAIVFGESSYRFCSPLKNPVNDANDISDSLKKVGFTVFTYQNIDEKTMNDAIDSWSEKLKNYDVALFYFSGHGAEIKGENYLFPIEINPKGPSDLNYSAYSANKILDRLSNSNLKYGIIILDACRNNPFIKGWSRDAGSSGLAEMSGKNLFIAFAASPGATASDGFNRNGIYTEAILKNITTPNLNIYQIFTRVNKYVRSKTQNEQIPFINSSLESDYCFSITHNYKTSLKEQTLAFLQPNSGIALSEDEGNLFTVNNDGGISVHDLNTLDIDSNVVSVTGKPSLITYRKGTLFIADSLNHSVSIMNWKSKNAIKSFNLDYSPLGIIPSLENRELFICGNNKNNGILSKIDLQTYKLIKSIPISHSIGMMVMSTDGKKLYLSSRTNNDFITIIDIKTEKIIKETNPIKIGDVIGITPDDKKLYTNNPDNSQIKVFDLNTNKLIKTIDNTATSFAFTADSKYAFALSNSKITIIRNSDFEIISVMPFVNLPKGIAFSTDGNGFVWLPGESRVFTFSISDQIKNNNINDDPEIKFKKFQEEINNDPSLPEKQRKRNLCIQLDNFSQQIYNTIISNEVSKILNQLNINYSMSRRPPYLNCDDLKFTCSAGIFLLSDPTKTINPLIEIQFSNNEAILSMISEKFDKIADTFHFYFRTVPAKPGPDIAIISEADQNSIRKFIREYFFKRIDYLKK